MKAGLSLLRRCLPGRGAVGRLLVFSAAESAPALLCGLALAHAVDAFRRSQPLTVVWWLTALAAATLLGALATRGMYAVLAVVVEETRDGLARAAVHGSVARLGATGHGGALPLTQVLDQVDQVRNLLSALLRNLRSTVVPLGAACVGLLLLQPQLAAAVVVPLGAGLLVYGWLLPTVVTRHRASAVLEERLGAELPAVLGDLPAVRGLHAENAAADWLRGHMQAVGRAEVAVSRAHAGRHVVMAVGAYVPVLSVLVVAAPLLRSGRLSTGEVVGATAYVLTVLAPALGSLVSGSGGWLTQLLVLLERMAAVADRPAPLGSRAPESAPAPLAVRVRALSYSHSPDSEPLFAGLDLEVLPGELVAVVGASGVGKSTLLHLLAGLLAPGDGAIAVNGTTCLIPQDPYLFSGSLRENLGYLAPPAPAESALVDAARAFGVGPLLDRLGGTDGQVDPADGSISAAERQRVVLARASLCEAAVLLLDEALSHLTPDEEVAAERLLLGQGRTLIVVAHRLDVVRRADRVLYLDGRRAWAGAHAELLEGSPAYRSMYAFAEESRRGQVSGSGESLRAPSLMGQAVSADRSSASISGSTVGAMLTPQRG